MLELVRKGFLAGIGAIMLTKEKIQEATRNLVREGKITTDEAEKLTDELVESGERQWQEFNTKMSDTFKRWSETLDVVRKREFLDLKARVEVLETRLGLSETVQEDEPGEVSGDKQPQ